MEQNNNISNNTFNEEETSSFNFMEWAIRFLKYWYLFVLGVFIFLAIAYYQNRSFVPIYNSSLRMLLKQEAGSLSYMQGQGFNSVMNRLDQTNIENQILLLQSQDLIGRTIDSLPRFRVDFSKKLQFKNRPMYTTSCWSFAPVRRCSIRPCFPLAGRSLLQPVPDFDAPV